MCFSSTLHNCTHLFQCEYLTPVPAGGVPQKRQCGSESASLLVHFLFDNKLQLLLLDANLETQNCKISHVTVHALHAENCCMDILQICATFSYPTGVKLL